MHEVAIAQNLLDIACQSAKENDLRKIDKISVVAGELNAIVLDALQFAFQVISQNTIAEGASLEYRQIPALVKCESCNKEFHWKESGYFCPYCFQLSNQLIQGNELYVDYIEGKGEDEYE